MVESDDSVSMKVRGEDEEKEVQQRVPATTKAPEGPQVPVAKKK